MTNESAGERVAQLRSNLQQACQLAAAGSPRMLDRCRPLLEEVRHGLERLREERPPDPWLPARMVTLRRELERFGLLLEGAAEFYGGWQRLRASLTGGYDATGDPVSVETRNRLTLEA